MQGDPKLAPKLRRDIEMSNVRLFKIEIEHDLLSTSAKHVGIKELKGGAKWEAVNRDFVFCLRTPNPSWAHKNDMIVHGEDAAGLKRHAETILEALSGSAKCFRGNGQEILQLQRKVFRFSDGYLNGEFIRLRRCYTGGLTTYMHYWLMPTKK